MLSQQEHHKRLAESTIAWWRDAGVDYICDGEVKNWLAPPVIAAAVSKAAPTPAPKAAIAAPPVAPLVAKLEWPNSLSAINAAIQDGAALPGCNYGQSRALPVGQSGAQAMIIGDCPEEEEVFAGTLGHGPAAALLKNMLLAAGLLPDLTFQTALALSRPATSSIPKDDLPLLATFMQHQIALVQPKMIVLTGSAACEAFLGQDLMQARGNLHYINHDDRKTAAVATFHPRTLLAQLQLKGQAWKDMQMLARKDCL